MSVKSRLAGFRREMRELRALLRENSWQTCADLWIDRLLRRRRHRMVRIGGVALEVRSLSPDVSVALESLGGELRCLELAYPRDSQGVIVDAGGYIGTAAIAMAQMYPAATVICIEPSSDNFALLCRNTRAFPNIKPMNAALVPIGGPERVSLGDRGTGAWGFTIVGSASDREVRAMESVSAVPIDRVVALPDRGRLMFMKMDIEGAEVDILESIGVLLEDIPILVIELHERIVPGCEALFMSRCADRFVFRLEGEKYVAVSAALFRRRAAIGLP
jgi:FkbM family methyltransferase